MKKLLKNKKLMTGIITAMIGVSILMAGLAYSWFALAGASSSDGITLGELDIAASLDTNSYTVGEPGVAVINQVGHIQSKGSVSALVKLSLSGTVTIKSDVNGKPLDQADYRTIENDPNIVIELQESGFEAGGVPALGLWLDNDDIYMWGAYDNSYYVAMDGNRELPFAYTVNLSGNMGNEYMNAEIDVHVNWEATQLLADGAIKDIFGIDDIATQIAWFDGYFYDFNASGMRAFAVNSARYAELIEKLPECAFKRLIEGILA